jgi:hypothetical protein
VRKGRRSRATPEPSKAGTIAGRPRSGYVSPGGGRLDANGFRSPSGGCPSWVTSWEVPCSSLGATPRQPKDGHFRTAVPECDIVAKVVDGAEAAGLNSEPGSSPSDVEQRNQCAPPC